jgi:hypothetical protein
LGCSRLVFAKRVVERTGEGRLYIIKLVLENNDVVHKIGMTHSDRSIDRMMEILRSWFVQYRYVPLAKLRLDHATGVPLLFEKHMHEILKEYKWVPDKKVSGGQEMFQDLDEAVVIDYIKNFDYQTLMEGKQSMNSDDVLYILSQKDNKFNPDEDIPF